MQIIGERLFDRIRLWHIVAAAIVLALMGMRPGITVGGDDARYVLMARTFANNGILRTLMSSHHSTAWAFYFMLPLLMTPFVKFAPDNYLLMKILPLSALVLAIIVLNLFLRGQVTDRQRKMIVLLFAVNPFVIEHAGLLLTDMPYLLALLMAFLFYKMYEMKHARGYLFLAIVAAGCSLYMRPVGLAICIAILMHLIFKKRIKESIFCALILLAVCMPLFVSNGATFLKDHMKIFIGKQDFYAYHSRNIAPSQLTTRIGYNMLVYTGNYLPDIMIRPIVESINPRLSTKAVNPIFIPKFLAGIVLSGIIILGFLSTCKRSIEPLHFYVIAHLGIILVINIYVARYLLSMLPIFLIFFVAGLESLVHAIGLHGKARAMRVSYLVVILLVCISLLGDTVQALDARRGIMAPEIKSFIECNDWIKANAPRDAVILTRKPEYTSLTAGLPVVVYIISKDPEEQMQYIKANRVRYVIVSDLGFYLHEATYVREAIQKHPEQFRLVYTSQARSEDRVYEVIGHR